MNTQREDGIAGLSILLESLSILKSHLVNRDDDGAHEAITVMLMQGLDIFGSESTAMQQFFPVMEEIKQRIDFMSLDDALRQAELFDQQLREVISLLQKG